VARLLEQLNHYQDQNLITQPEETRIEAAPRRGVTSGHGGAQGSAWPNVVSPQFDVAINYNYFRSGVGSCP
jgi:hypothetical protein